ncbi:MAG: hypothetical protein HUU47_02425 [Bacteroidetes bacterium]|nr:hypothetical protein [Bacteroidota bacterium]
MISTFTQEELLLFIYGEAEHQLENQIKTALKVDFNLQIYYQQLIETIGKLDVSPINPNETSCKIILEVSSISQGESLVN